MDAGSRAQGRGRLRRRGPRPRGAVRSALVRGRHRRLRDREVRTRSCCARSRAWSGSSPTPPTGISPTATRSSRRSATRRSESSPGAWPTRMSQVRAGPHTPTGARLRLRAVGQAYLEFARTEPGLFDTAFAPPTTIRAVRRPTSRRRSHLLQSALDNLVACRNPGARPSPGHRVPDLGHRPWPRRPPPRTSALAARAREDAPRGPDARVHRGVRELSGSAVTAAARRVSRG